MRNSEIIARANSYIKRNFWRAVVITLVVAAIPFLLNFFVGLGGTTLSGLFFGDTQPSAENILAQVFGLISFQGLIFLITWIITSLLVIGEKWAYLEMVDTEKLNLQTIFRSFVNRFGRNIWHNILQVLLITFWTVLAFLSLVFIGLLGSWLLANYGDASAGLIIFLGITFTIISVLALFIWLIIIRYWFILSEFILYDSPEISAYQALKASRYLMKRNKWQLFTLAVRIYIPLILLSIAMPVAIFILALLIQEPVWLLGLLSILIYIGYFIYAFVIHIRWRGSLAVFYRDLTSFADY